MYNTYDKYTLIECFLEMPIAWKVFVAFQIYSGIIMSLVSIVKTVLGE